MHETSATLLLRLKADGDLREVAWAEFCDRYEPVIAGFARRLGLPADQIPDVVQQIVRGARDTACAEGGERVGGAGAERGRGGGDV